MRARTIDLWQRLTIVGSIAAIALTASPTADARPAADRDRDRLPDRWELRYGMSPRAKGTFGNPDGDELINHYEFLAGTSPRTSDSDGDGTRDGMEDPDADGVGNAEEQYLGTHPRRADSDRDGVLDGADDADEDGVSNHDEFVAATDPRSACADDDDLARALGFERTLGMRLRLVAHWYPADLGYFDGAEDLDCPDGDETETETDADEGADEDVVDATA